ncbi:MAG: hypothetical protein JNM70_01195 [Anaerolineae bacterium]|nr:hypothetical protein [Anaerolineae bacterium]
MSEREPQSYPTNGVSREDVFWIRPDLAELGDSRTEAQIEGIAFDVGEVLQEMYWDALEMILDKRYPIVEDEEEADPPTLQDIP